MIFLYSMNFLHKNRALCTVQNSAINYIHTETLINMSQNILFFFTLLLMKAVMMFFRRQIVHVSVFNSPATDGATFHLQGLTWYVLYFFHVQAMVWLLTFGIFNMHQMLMQVMAHGRAVQIAKSLHWKGILGKKFLQHQGVEPASAVCQPDIQPTKLPPHYRELNLHQQNASPMFTQLTYLPTPNYFQNCFYCFGWSVNPQGMWRASVDIQKHAVKS